MNKRLPRLHFNVLTGVQGKLFLWHPVESSSMEFDDETAALFTELSKELYDTDVDENPQERREVLEEIEAKGFQKIGISYQRAVFELPNDRLQRGNIERAVVKFPTRDRGLEQNENEIEVWKTAPQKIKSYLLPILDYNEDCYWLAMPYAETIDSTGSRPFELEDALEVDRGQLELRKRDNWGMWKGKILLLDYGSYVNVWLK